MSWRLASRLSVVTLALLVVLVVAIYSLRMNTDAPAASVPTVNQSGLQGTSLDGTPAPDFHLKDQFGKSISLSQFKGHPVIVTFLYTHCLDVCPLIADKMHMVEQSLGKNAGHVTILAVSMDPKGDTQNAAVSFSKTHKMLNSWHFLIGTQSQLSPIWTAYSVDAQAATSPDIVTHSTAIYVIDDEGRERILLDNDFTVPQLSNDVKVLLNE